MSFSRIVFECEKPYPVTKCADLENVSDMNEVKRLANKLLSTKYYDGGVVPLAVSNRKGKKFMIQSPDGKWIHFGDINLEDYTKHKDEDRLDRFLTRNRRFKDADTFTPAWMAYHLLWGKGLGSSKVAPDPLTPDDITRAVFGNKRIVYQPAKRKPRPDPKDIQRAQSVIASNTAKKLAEYNDNDFIALGHYKSDRWLG